MKLGFNLLLWTGHVTQAHAPLLKALKRTGYDGVEIPLFEGDVDHYKRLGELIARHDLEVTTVSVLGEGHNPLSPDAAVRTAALGAKILAGPMQAQIGYFSGNPATAVEHRRGQSYHRHAGDHGARKGVWMAVEALNRFEIYFINTMQQLSDHLDIVDHPHVKAMYDTFHCNIEEKDPVAAIRTIRKHLIHVHISENDRGTPGKGHVPWGPTYKALRAAKYDGWLTIEAFGRALPALAAATRVWRDFFPSPEEVYKLGYRNMRDGWRNAKR